MFRFGIRQDGLSNPTGNLSLSGRERERETGDGGKERGERKERQGEGYPVEKV